MLGLGTQTLQWRQNTGWEGQVEGEKLAGICVIPEGKAVYVSLMKAGNHSVSRCSPSRMQLVGVGLVGLGD